MNFKSSIVIAVIEVFVCPLIFFAAVLGYNIHNKHALYAHSIIDFNWIYIVNPAKLLYKRVATDL